MTALRVLVIVSVGAFADASFPPPTASEYDSRRHPWIGLPDAIERVAPELWDSVGPLYDAGRYAEAADRGRELLAGDTDFDPIRGEPAFRELMPD